MTSINAAAETMRPLRTLQAQMLTETELTTLQMFLRVGSQRMACEWRLVAGGPVDVLLVGGDQPIPISGLGSKPAVVVRVVNKPGSGDAHQLIRPLFYDAFVELLQQLEKQDSASETTNSHANAAVVEIRLAASTNTESRSGVPEGARMRLRRWPSSAVLSGARHNVVLATFLSTRHLTLSELARLSNVEPDRCTQFIHMLDELSLLDIESSEPSGPAPIPSPSMERQDPVAQPKTGRETGLFGLIRRKLGLVAAR